MSKRETLLNSAEALVRRKGYDGFSFADLAKEAGIRKASVHYYFETKGALTADLVTRYEAAMAAARDVIDLGQPAPKDAMEQFARIYRDALGKGDTICLCAALSAGRENLPEIARDALDSYYDATLAWLERYLVRSQARSVLALVEGAQILARTRQDLQVFEDATNAFLLHLTDGPTAPAEPLPKGPTS